MDWNKFANEQFLFKKGDLVRPITSALVLTVYEANASLVSVIVENEGISFYEPKDLIFLGECNDE
jgi:hypothetical protein